MSLTSFIAKTCAIGDKNGYFEMMAANFLIILSENTILQNDASGQDAACSC